MAKPIWLSVPVILVPIALEAERSLKPINLRPIYLKPSQKEKENAVGYLSVEYTNSLA